MKHTSGGMSEGLRQLIRTAVEQPGPAGLLEVVGPLYGQYTDEVERTELVSALIADDSAETTAVLHVVRLFVGSELEGRRIDRELGMRGHHLPAWVGGLARASVGGGFRVATMFDGSFEYHLFDVLVPGAQPVGTMVTIDAMAGGVIENVLFADVGMEELSAVIQDDVPGAPAADPMIQGVADSSESRMGSAIDMALWLSDSLVPAWESEGWPRCGPLLRWLVGLFTPPPEMSEEELARADREAEAAVEGLLREFLASVPGRRLRDDENRGFFADFVNRYGHTYNGGDPLAWSPARVAEFYVRCSSKVIAAPLDFLDVPAVLHAYVRFALDKSDASQEFIDECLFAVVEGAGPFLEDALADDYRAPYPGYPDYDAYPVARTGREIAAERVGGEAALASLDDVPLPSEDFDDAAVDHRIRDEVVAWKAEVDRWIAKEGDVELATAYYRVLADAAQDSPRMFQRGAAPCRGAAGVIGCVHRQNRAGPPMSHVQKFLGLKSPIADRVASVSAAVGLYPTSLFSDSLKCKARYLTGESRARLLRLASQ